MSEFDLQRFAEEDNSADFQTEEKREIPEELSGLPEDIALETLNEWKQSQPEDESTEEESPEEESKPPAEDTVPYVRFKEKVNEANQLKSQLAEYQRRAQTQPQSQIKVTAEDAKKINQAILAEAMQLSGFSKDDVESLKYADEDDPRILQFQQAKDIAKSNIFNEIRQLRFRQQQQAQQFLASQTAAINIYNEFAAKEFAEPDFKEIQQFATKDFFNKLPPNEQQIIAGAYFRVERQIASPAEMLVVKNYYERAKTAYRTGKKNLPKSNKTMPTLPRADKLKGTVTADSNKLTAGDIEKLLESDFTKLDDKTRNILLGLS